MISCTKLNIITRKVLNNRMYQFILQGNNEIKTVIIENKNVSIKGVQEYYIHNCIHSVRVIFFNNTHLKKKFCTYKFLLF